MYELLHITPEIKRLVVGWATQDELRRLAVSQGMRTLQRGGGRAGRPRRHDARPKSSARSTRCNAEGRDRCRSSASPPSPSTARRVAGVEDAATLGDVHTHLADRDLLPIQVEPKKSVLQYRDHEEEGQPRDLMHFSRQLGVFIRAGIPIIDALEVISSETTDKVFKPALDDMIERAARRLDLRRTRPRATPRSFPPFYLGILRSAEVTGNLDIVLDQLADYIDRDIDARQKVTSALVYPCIVLGMAVVTVVVLDRVRAPAVRDVLRRASTPKLPLPTRMLLDVHALHRPAGAG